MHLNNSVIDALLVVLVVHFCFPENRTGASTKPWFEKIDKKEEKGYEPVISSCL